MKQTRKINPDRLKFLLDRSTLSQKELAAKIGIDVGTLSRWKRGKIKNIRSGKLEKLCQLLGTTQTELFADGPLTEAAAARDAARRDQVTMTLDTACRNALTLVARRYGVTRQQIVEAAPLLFALIAEESLVERRKKLEAYHGAALPHLRGSLFGPYDDDDQKTLEAEERSINERDLFAVQVGSWNEHHHKDNPFAHFLNERLSETGLPAGKAVTWKAGEAPSYMIGIKELIDLLGRDKDALQLVLSGKVALAEMPGDIRKAKPGARAMWVRDKAVLNDNQLLAELAEVDLKSLDLAGLANKWREATANDEKDF